jgi:hypothetical protein
VCGCGQRYSIPHSEIAHFFENGAKHKGQLEWVAEKDHFPAPIFLEKKEYVLLQAGDFIAWHHYSFLGAC